MSYLTSRRESQDLEPLVNLGQFFFFFPSPLTPNREWIPLPKLDIEGMSQVSEHPSVIGHFHSQKMLLISL